MNENPSSRLLSTPSLFVGLELCSGSGLSRGALAGVLLELAPPVRPALTPRAVAGGKGQVGGVDCYISGSGTASAVIIFSDVWGWDSGRIRSLADELAASGHLVVIPKLLQPALEGGTDGDGLPPDFDLGARGADFGPWVTQIPWSTIEPQVDAILADLNGRGITKIGHLGTCWGAWAGFHTAASGKLSCGVNCHPSVQLEGMFGGSDLALAETVKCPQMMLPAGGDNDNTKPGGEMQAIFDKQPWGSDCVYQEFPEMEHGWVPRGVRTLPPLPPLPIVSTPDSYRVYVGQDDSDAAVAEGIKAAMELAKGFFQKHLVDASL